MNFIRITAILILFSLSSCLTILQSLATYDSVITDDRLLGNWIKDNSTIIPIQKFMNSNYRNIFKDTDLKYTKEDSILWTKLYIISFSENNLEYTWLASLCKINNQYYANLIPDKCLNKSAKEAYNIDGVMTSSIARLEWKSKNSLTLYFLNGNHIKEIILNGKARLRHEYDPMFDNLVITASSNELLEFLKKYGNNESLFEGGQIIILNRKN